MPNGFKVHIKKKLALLNFTDQKPEEWWTKTGNIIREKLKQ